jgi:predicted transposase/invertase (TIGR01784 family)
MRRTLDPKLDVVFKLLFADERNRPLLISLLTAVLEPAQPIAEVVVLNPDTPKEAVVDKGAVLDVRVQLSDGTQANVEMQAARHPGLRQRVLYYWARLYTAQLMRGNDYVDLAPAVSVFILGFDELETERYHSIFRLLEVHDQSCLSEDLCVHVLELAKLPESTPAPGDPDVLRWAKFFAAETDQELEQLAMNNPEMTQAKTALERLSADPAARELARERELAAWNYERTLRLARQEGLNEGRREGLDEGRREGLDEGRREGLDEGRRELLLKQLRLKFGSLPETVVERVTNASPTDVERWAERVLTAHRIEDVLGS